MTKNIIKVVAAIKKLITLLSILLINLFLFETGYAHASSYVNSFIVNQKNYDLDTDKFTYKTGKSVIINNSPIFYTNTNTVNFTSSKNIISYSVDEMETRKIYTDIIHDDGLSSCSYKLGKKNFEYIFAVNLENGYTKYFRYYYDCTAPVFGFKKNEKIHAGCIIDASDEGSGIKTITLNGKKVPEYYRFAKKGSYTIKVTDAVGNKSSIKVICTSNCPSWASKLPSIYKPKIRAAAIAKKLKINNYGYSMECYNRKTILTLFTDRRTHKFYDYNGTYLPGVILNN